MHEDPNRGASSASPHERSAVMTAFAGQYEVYFDAAQVGEKVSIMTLCPYGALEECDADLLAFAYNQRLPLESLKCTDAEQLTKSVAEGAAVGTDIGSIPAPEAVWRAAAFADDAQLFDAVTVWSGLGEAYIVGEHGTVAYLLARFSYTGRTFLSGDEVLGLAMSRKYGEDIAFFRDLTAIVLCGVFTFGDTQSLFTWLLASVVGMALVPLLFARTLPPAAIRLMAEAVTLVALGQQKLRQFLAKWGV